MAPARGLTVLFLCEMWERFSYYGMRSLLLLYMVQSLGYSVAHAATVYGLYTALIYFTPTLGGLLADRYLGQRRAIVLGGVLMAAGHFLLAIPTHLAFVGALLLLILGCGLFKPNVSVLVGRLYADNDPRRDAAFNTFYMGINLGAFVSPLVCGTLGQVYGWHLGFGAAGIGMVFGLVVFLLGQGALGDVGLPPNRRAGATTLDAALLPIRNESGQSGPSSAGAVPSTVVRERMLVLLALALFGQVIFWTVFEQAGSSLTLFAENVVTRPQLGSHGQMPSSWFQAANPLFITLFAPLLSRLWPRLAARNAEPSVPWKFALGLMLVAAGFGVLVVAGQRLDADAHVSPLWLLAAYALNTLGELCVSPIGLAIVTKLAPPAQTSALMGGWLASMALGNYIGGSLAGLYGQMSLTDFFGCAAGLALGSAIVLSILAPRLTRMMHLAPHH